MLRDAGLRLQIIDTEQAPITDMAPTRKKRKDEAGSLER